MDPDDRKRPTLRRETIVPPGSVDLYSHYKTLRENDGQLIRWERLPEQGVLTGVCAGLARRFGMKPWKVRLAFALGALLFAGLTIAYYLLATIFVRPCRGLTPGPIDDRMA